MNKQELLDRCAGGDREARLLLARTLDKLESAQRCSVPAYTHFLSPAQRAIVESLLHSTGNPPHLMDGGYPGAERAVCVFLPDWLDPENWPAGESPLAAVKLSAPSGSSLSHRDWLGAILGLGLTREKLGDLLVAENVCQAVAFTETAEILLSQMDQVGRFPVRASLLPLEELIPTPRSVKLLRDTVSSLRLDAVTASAFSVPRARACTLISTGKISLNYRECLKPDQAVREGDCISCRGMGKCRVSRVCGQSKKGRMIVEMERYI